MQTIVQDVSRPGPCAAAIAADDTGRLARIPTLLGEAVRLWYSYLRLQRLPFVLSPLVAW